MVNEYLENLLERANSETDSRRRRVSRAVVNTVAAFFAAYAIIVSAAAYFHDWRLMVFTSGLSAIPVSIALGSRLSIPFMQVIRELAACDDTRAIPALSEAALHGRGALQDTAAKALVRLLLKVTEADSSIFTPEVTIAQRRLVHRSRDLKLALLSAYTHVGRVSELTLANRIVHQANGKDEELFAAAARCVAAIQQRTDDLKTRDMLLRTSATPAAGNLLLAVEVPTSDGSHVPLENNIAAGTKCLPSGSEQERLSH